ncbi:MAG: hypothetical protein ACREGH_01975 [Minisyncoccia bacterium]
MNDVQPLDGQRSIRNIPVPPRHGQPADAEFRVPDNRGSYRLPPQHPPHRRRRRFWLWAILVIIICAGLGAAASLLFSGATITIQPRQANITASNPVTAVLDPSQGELGYEELTASSSAEKQVTASGSAPASTSAQGTITIYNKYSTSPQKLVTQTRFETPDGKIYKIHAPVTVPGEKKSADGSVTPGSVSVTAYADEPGEQYNIGATQFSVPGFKGQPEYNGFYATTEGMSGGFVGLQPTVSTSDKDSATQNLQVELQTQLQSNLANLVPHGYVLIASTTVVSLGDVVENPTGSSTATLTEDGTATAAAVKTADLAAALAATQVSGYQGEPVDFVDPQKLSITVGSDTPYTAGALELSLNVSLPQIIVWQIDSSKVASALADKSSSSASFNQIMDTFKPAVATASASLRPFWNTKFPADPSKINVSIENPGT